MIRNENIECAETHLERRLLMKKRKINSKNAMHRS